MKVGVRRSVELGRTGITLAPLGVGAMTWGSRSFMAYGGADSPEQEAEAFGVSLQAGITLFDTAEMYGRGRSEQRLGELLRDHPEVFVATKFAPLWWRRAGSVDGVLSRSLERLGRPRADLYQVHWRPRFIGIPALMDELAREHAAGRVRAIGVSNFSAVQLREAHAALAHRGVPLASNQVQYSLLCRQPETDGVLAACRELGISLVAYSPLAAGALTGKYGVAHRPGGVRRMLPYFRARNWHRVEPVLDALREIADNHDAEPAQVALTWLIDQGAIPIPGAKNRAQAETNAGALRLELGFGEREALAKASAGWRNPAA